MRSKKQSASRRRPEPPVIFLDECVDTKSLATALLAQGVTVERHRDHFAQGVLDVDWIPIVSTRGWVILTADKRQRRTALEIAAIVEAEARVFVVRAKGLSGEQMGALVAGQVKRIVNVANGQPAPFVAYVSRSGVAVIDQRRSMRRRVQ